MFLAFNLTIANSDSYHFDELVYSIFRFPANQWLKAFTCSKEVWYGTNENHRTEKGKNNTSKESSKREKNIFTQKISESICIACLLRSERMHYLIFQINITQVDSPKNTY